MASAGTIKKFFEDKGFGFISPDDGSEDVFVHRKCHGDGQDRTAYLSEGDAVTYESEYDDRKGKYSASTCTGFNFIPSLHYKQTIVVYQLIHYG